MFSFVPECLSPLCQNQVFGLVWRILLHKMDDPSQHRNRIKSNIMNKDSFFWQNYTIVYKRPDDIFIKTLLKTSQEVRNCPYWAKKDLIERKVDFG